MFQENHLTLGDIAIPEKGSETAAIPELLDLADVEGDIVAIDTLVCQKAIVKKIAGKKADYVIALKENQRTLCEDARLYFDKFRPEMEAGLLLTRS